MTPEELRRLVADAVRSGKLKPGTWYCLHESDYTPKRYLSWIFHIKESEVSRICEMHGKGSTLNVILGSEGVKILPATQSEAIGTGKRWFCVNMKPTDDLGVTLGVSAQLSLLTKSCSEYDNTSSSRRRTSDRRTTLEGAAARNHRKRPACAISSGDLLSSSYGAASTELPSSSSSSSSPSLPLRTLSRHISPRRMLRRARSTARMHRPLPTRYS